MAEFRWIHMFLSVILMLQLTGRNTDTFINEITKVYTEDIIIIIIIIISADSEFYECITSLITGKLIRLFFRSSRRK